MNRHDQIGDSPGFDPLMLDEGGNDADGQFRQHRHGVRRYGGGNRTGGMVEASSSAIVDLSPCAESTSVEDRRAPSRPAAGKTARVPKGAGGPQYSV
jgi:hypothetical protein